MIDLDQFNSWFAMLMDRFGRTMGAPAIQEYYQYLSQHLNTEQWVQAARAVFHSSDHYFPSSERLLAAAGQSGEQQAILEWTLICQHPYDYAHPSYPEGLSAAAIAALNALGGMRFLHHAELEQRSHLRRDFLATYKAYTSPTAKLLGLRPSLPPPSLPFAPFLDHPFPLDGVRLPAIESLRKQQRKPQAIPSPSAEGSIPSGIETIKTAFTAMTGIAVVENKGGGEGGVDMGMAIVKIDEECVRLHWSHAQRDQAIEQRYQKRGLAHLDDPELLTFLDWLKIQAV
jgi:hypothetical protein